MLTKIPSNLSLQSSGTVSSQNEVSDEALTKVGFVLSETSDLARIGDLLKSDPEFDQAMRLANANPSVLSRASSLAENRLSNIKKSLMQRLIFNEAALSPAGKANRALLLKPVVELAKIQFGIEALLPLSKRNEAADDKVKALQYSFRLKTAGL